MTILVWLQRELRLQDHPALVTALENAKAQSKRVVLAYFHDTEADIGTANSANSVWLAHSLQQLQVSVGLLNGHLLMPEGNFTTKFAEVMRDFNVTEVMYSVQVGEPFVSQQQQVATLCRQHKASLTPFFSESLLHPDSILNKQGKPYAVFTPFYKAVQPVMTELWPALPAPTDLSLTQVSLPEYQACLDLPPSLMALKNQRWAKKMMMFWLVGEEAAWRKLSRFSESFLENYPSDRDIPALRGTSRLSAHLHFGELSPRSIYFYLQAQMESGEVSAESGWSWLRQLVWAEFAKYLLWHFPFTEQQPFQEKFKGMDWLPDQTLLSAWKRGKTGVPIVDAGMRELWKTGSMHNRVRMLVASFLTKNLNQSWLQGVDWFNHTLVDADPANNVMGWQWVAGCGVDAAPYYRLFNPVLQSEKFDPEGRYLRNWLPELKGLSNEAIHAPWLHLSEAEQQQFGLGEVYPFPIVDLKESREAHLQRVEALKQLKFAIV